MVDKESNCNHEDIKYLSLKSSKYPHMYCPTCGTHIYKDKTYTKEEWYETFIRDFENIS